VRLLDAKNTLVHATGMRVAAIGVEGQFVAQVSEDLGVAPLDLEAGLILGAGRRPPALEICSIRS